MRLNAIVNMPGFTQLSPSVRHDLMVRAVDGSRETARTLVMMQNPDIIKQATDNKVAKLRGPATVH